MSLIYTKYIHTLLENIDYRTIPVEMDLVLDSGAFNGLFMYGGLLYIKELELLGKTRVNRISGSSVGALSGCLYILNKFDVIENIYEKLRSGFNNTINLHILYELIDKEFSQIDESSYKQLNSRLFINYIDINEKREIVVSEYTSNSDVIEKLKKSTFIPVITNNHLTYDNCIDAMTPYIFTEKNIERKILFINLFKIGGLKQMLNIFHDKNIAHRTLSGILDIHDFFLKTHPSQMCSYVNDWNLIDYTLYRIRELAWLIIVYLIYVGINIYKCLPKSITESLYMNTIHDLALKYFKEVMYCTMLQ